MKAKQRAIQTLEDLIFRYPVLQDCRDSILEAFNMLSQAFHAGNKLLLCGNGGSAADCEHIVGELMKSFRLPRPISPELKSRLLQQGTEGTRLAERLQGALPCVALTGHLALSTAFSNDVDPKLVFAQQVYGLASPGDVLWGISTSGSSANVCAALQTASAMGISTLGMTGKSGGKMNQLCSVVIRVPEEETYRIQELHLPVYHALCAALEQQFFG